MRRNGRAFQGQMSGRKGFAPCPGEKGEIPPLAAHRGDGDYNSGSPWADYWRETITEPRGDLLKSGKLTDALIDAFLAQCADSNWWTQTIAFTAVHARTRESLNSESFRELNR